MQIVGRDRSASLDDRPNMPFTNATLLETLRMAGVAFRSLPHYTLDNIKMGPYDVPKGCIVFADLYGVMHDKNHFQDPDTFNPERFLNADGHFTPHDHVIPFGYGQRECLGKSLAERELFLFAVTILQRFDLQPSGGSLPGYLPTDYKMTGLLRNPPAFRMVVKRRD